MLDHQKRLNNPQSIAVFRALVLGDLLCAVPAFRALRRAYPQSKVTLVGLPWANAFAKRFSHLFDDFLSFPGYPGLPEIKPALDEIPHFFKEAQQKQFDAAIQMHGSGSFVNSITVLMDAKQNAGFFLPGEYCPDEHLFMPFPENEHEIHKYIKLMEFLNVPEQGTNLEFPITEEDVAEFEAIEGAETLGEYVCVHPGARLLSRRWLPERFAAVADELASRGFTVVLTGSKEEEGLVNLVSNFMHEPHLNWVGKTTLGTLAVLLSKSKLLLCNDTGVSHLASALSVPSIVIVTGSDFKRWAPLNRERHQIVYSEISCRPCGHYICPIGQPCANDLQINDVIRLIKTFPSQIAYPAFAEKEGK
jgi:ADP-heptose:LPS heptosyltransferase